ncbi:hypothetical protein [Proteus terrae]|uniref:hypothetical protein n=1 Tax=Proteus terrae TaxID=1574161 RepID=UPI001BA516AE|nr:hypothetical protein [Proteus terrae]
MNNKINSIEYFFVVAILSSVVLFFIGILFYFSIHGIFWLFIGADFSFSFDSLKKIIKVATIGGVGAGIGSWFIEYKLRK